MWGWIPSSFINKSLLYLILITSRVNLVRRGVAVENLLCCLCGEEEVSSCHLFFVCRFAWRVWCLCFKWLGVSSVIHKNLSQIFHNSGWVRLLFRLTEFGVQFGLALWAKSGNIGTRSSSIEVRQMCLKCSLRCK